MKKIAFGFTVLLLSVVGYSQLKVVQFGKGADLNGTTIDVSGSASDNELAFYMETINEGSSDVELKIVRTEVDALTGTENATCWVVCPPEEFAGVEPVLVSAFSETIAPNDTNATFSAHYYPNNIDGCSLLKYDWVDAQNTSTVYATVYIRYLHGTSVCMASVVEDNIDFELYPNPVNDEVNIQLSESYNSNLSVRVVNVLGQAVVTSKIGSGNVFKSISTANLVDGVYFVTFESNNKTVLTKKIVVRH